MDLRLCHYRFLQDLCTISSSYLCSQLHTWYTTTYNFFGATDVCCTILIYKLEALHHPARPDTRQLIHKQRHSLISRACGYLYFTPWEHTPPSRSSPSFGRCFCACIMPLRDHILSPEIKCQRTTKPLAKKLAHVSVLDSLHIQHLSDLHGPYHGVKYTIKSKDTRSDVRRIGTQIPRP